MGIVQVTDETSTTPQPSKNAGDAFRRVQTEQAGQVSGQAFRMGDWLSKAWSGLSLSRVQPIVGVFISMGHGLSKAWSAVSLTRVQAIVGVLTGIVTITAGLYSLMQFSGPAAGMGELVAVVQEAASERSVTDATIEILTPLNALVATLTPDSRGRARQSLKEGIYVVRVNHPRYAAEVRQIQVFPKQTVEIKASLHAGSTVPLEPVKRTVNGGVRAVRRAFGF